MYKFVSILTNLYIGSTVARIDFYFRNNHVERDVMGFGGQQVKSALFEADTDFLGLGLSGQEAVVVAATVADAVQRGVETKHRYDDDVK